MQPHHRVLPEMYELAPRADADHHLFCEGESVGVSGTNWLIVALVAACAAAVCLVVALARARRLHAEAMEDRGWLLERERESAARTAVDAERSRIARELH